MAAVFKSRALRAALGSIAMALAAANHTQIRANDVLLTWFGRGDCDPTAGPYTHVLLPQGAPQRVPNSASFPSYRVTCSDAPLNMGSFEYCTDVAGEDCPLLVPFTPGACVQNDGAAFGADSFRVTCPGPGEGAPPDLVTLGPNRFAVTYYALPGCDGTNSATVDRTVVSGQQGLCQRVPNAPTSSGYRVVCDEDGSGRGHVQFCADAQCGQCEVVTPFQRGECSGSDREAYGAASYSVGCPAAPAPPPPPPKILFTSETVIPLASVDVETLLSLLPALPSIPSLPPGLSNEQAMMLLSTLTSTDLSALLASIPTEDVARYVASLSPASAAALLRLLPPETLPLVLSALPRDVLSALLALLPLDDLVDVASSLTVEQLAALLQSASLSDLSMESVSALILSLPEETLLDLLPKLGEPGQCPPGYAPDDNSDSTADGVSVRLDGVRRLYTRNTFLGSRFLSRKLTQRRPFTPPAHTDGLEVYDTLLDDSSFSSSSSSSTTIPAVQLAYTRPRVRVGPLDSSSSTRTDDSSTRTPPVRRRRKQRPVPIVVAPVRPAAPSPSPAYGPVKTVPRVGRVTPPPPRASPATLPAVLPTPPSASSRQPAAAPSPSAAPSVMSEEEEEEVMDEGPYDEGPVGETPWAPPKLAPSSKPPILAPVDDAPPSTTVEEEVVDEEEEQMPEEQMPEEQMPGEEEQMPGEQMPREEEQMPGEEEQMPGEQMPGEEEQMPEQGVPFPLLPEDTATELLESAEDAVEGVLSTPLPTLPLTVSIPIPSTPQDVLITLSETGLVTVSVAVRRGRKCTFVGFQQPSEEEREGENEKESPPQPEQPAPSAPSVPGPGTTLPDSPAPPPAAASASPALPVAPVVRVSPAPGPGTPGQPRPPPQPTQGAPSVPALGPAAPGRPAASSPPPSAEPAPGAAAPGSPPGTPETSPVVPSSPTGEGGTPPRLPPPALPLRGPVTAARSDDVRITWFARPDCNGTGLGEGYSGVVLPRTLCHVVPGSPNRGYAVFCSPDAAGGGVVQFCDDPVCSRCPISTPFEEDECLPNPARFGSSSAQLQCLNPLMPPPSPLPGRALIAWFEFDKCDTTHRTLVDVRQDVCQTVPRGAGVSNTGYKVQCDEDGSGDGTISFCASGTCSACGSRVRFASDQCLPNLPGLGSLSYTLRCPKEGGYTGDMLPSLRASPPLTIDGGAPIIVVPGQVGTGPDDETAGSGAAGVATSLLATAVSLALTAALAGRRGEEGAA